MPISRAPGKKSGAAEAWVPAFTGKTKGGMRAPRGGPPISSQASTSPRRRYRCVRCSRCFSLKLTAAHSPTAAEILGCGQLACSNNSEDARCFSLFSAQNNSERRLVGMQGEEFGGAPEGSRICKAVHFRMRCKTHVVQLQSIVQPADRALDCLTTAFLTQAPSTGRPRPRRMPASQKLAIEFRCTRS
jgi:hypothetical protein